MAQPQKEQCGDDCARMLAQILQATWPRARNCAIATSARVCPMCALTKCSIKPLLSRAVNGSPPVHIWQDKNSQESLVKAGGAGRATLPLACEQLAADPVATATLPAADVAKVADPKTSARLPILSSAAVDKWLYNSGSNECGRFRAVIGPAATPTL